MLFARGKITKKVWNIHILLINKSQFYETAKCTWGGLLTNLEFDKQTSGELLNGKEVCHG